MLESCTAIECCFDYSLLNISLNFDVSVDTCYYVISVRIEKLSFQLSFSNYIWGKYFKQTNSDEVSYYRKYFKHTYHKIPLMKCIFSVIQRTLVFSCETYPSTYYIHKSHNSISTTNTKTPSMFK